MRKYLDYEVNILIDFLPWHNSQTMLYHTPPPPFPRMHYTPHPQPLDRTNSQPCAPMLLVVDTNAHKLPVPKRLVRLSTLLPPHLALYILSLSLPFLLISDQEIDTTTTRQCRQQPCTDPLPSSRSSTPTIRKVSLWSILLLWVSLLRPIVHALLLLRRAAVVLLRRRSIVLLWRPIATLVVGHWRAILILRVGLLLILGGIGTGVEMSGRWVVGWWGGVLRVVSEGGDW